MKISNLNVQMFMLPNFMKLDVKKPNEVILDVGAMFANDKEAGFFWDDCKQLWLEHVRKRRDALGKSSEPST